MFKNYTAKENKLQKYLVILINHLGQKIRKFVWAVNRDAAESIALQGERIGTRVE